MNTYALLEDSMRLKDLILSEIDKNKNRPTNSFCSINALKRLNNMLDIVNHEIKERSRLLKEGKILGKKKIFRTFHYEHQDKSEIEMERRSNIKSVQAFKTKLPEFLNDYSDNSNKLSLNLKEEFTNFESKNNSKIISSDNVDMSISDELSFLSFKTNNNCSEKEKIAKFEKNIDNYEKSNIDVLSKSKKESMKISNLSTKIDLNSNFIPDKNENRNSYLIDSLQKTNTNSLLIENNFNEIHESNKKEKINFNDCNENQEFLNFSCYLRRDSFDNNSKKSNSDHNLYFYENPYSESKKPSTFDSIYKKDISEFPSKKINKIASPYQNNNDIKNKELDMLYAMNGLDNDQEMIDFLN